MRNANVAALARRADAARIRREGHVNASRAARRAAATIATNTNTITAPR